MTVCFPCWRKIMGDADPGPPKGNWTRENCLRCGRVTTYGLQVAIRWTNMTESFRPIRGG